MPYPRQKKQPWEMTRDEELRDADERAWNEIMRGYLPIVPWEEGYRWSGKFSTAPSVPVGDPVMPQLPMPMAPQPPMPPRPDFAFQQPQSLNQGPAASAPPFPELYAGSPQPQAVAAPHVPAGRRFDPMSMLAAGAAMLQNSGWQKMPVSFGQAAGAGLNAGMQTELGLRQQRQAEEFQREQLALSRMTREAQAAELDDRRKERERRAGLMQKYSLATTPEERMAVLEQMYPEEVMKAQLAAGKEKGQVVDLGDRVVIVDPRKIGDVLTKGLSPKDAAKGVGSLNQKEIAEIEGKLRDDFHQQAGKNFTVMRDSYDRILASAVEPSAAGDLALIYNYQKLLDPTSVVRETEFAIAASTGAYGEQIKAAVQKVMTGERLTDPIRNDFVDRAGKLYGSAEKNYRDSTEHFKGIAVRSGANPENVLPNIGLAGKKPEGNSTKKTFTLDNGSKVEAEYDSKEKKYFIIRNGRRFWVEE